MKGPFFIFLVLMPGFIFLIVLILLAMQYKQLKALVSPQPMPMAEVVSTPESRARVASRIDSFLVRTPAPAPSSRSDSASLPPASVASARDTLFLDATDLNDLIRAGEGMRKFQVDYHLSLEDTLIVARNAMPVERLNGFLATLAKIFGVHGFLNSEMKGYPLLESGKLFVVPVAAVMNGVAAPASVLSSKGKIEVREWASDTDAYDRAVKNLSGVAIRGGRLLLIRG
jgi:hypothetical protein